MSSEPAAAVGPRRLALVVAAHSAEPGAPPGIAAEAFAAACLADSYEVVSDLTDVSSGIVGAGRSLAELLWPGALLLNPGPSLSGLVAEVQDRYEEVVFVAADVPDLPGLVLAKVFRALQRADVCVAPERGGGGVVAFGVRAPWPDWVTIDVDLDANPLGELAELAPVRGRLATAPDWHRMRTATAVDRLDPGLEGWEVTRALLSGRSLRVD